MLPRSDRPHVRTLARIQAMFPPKNPRKTSITGGLCLLLALAACGGGDSEDTAAVYHPGPGLHQPLTLQFESGEAPDAASVELVRLDVPEDVDPWKVRAADYKVIPIAAREGREAFRALRIDNDNSMRVDIPGSFQPDKFNQIAVTVWCTQKEDFLLLLKRKGKTVIKTGGRRVEGHRHPKTVLFDVPETAMEDDPFNMISIVFAGRSGRSGLVSVSLVHRPWFNWLPSADEGGELVSIGERGHHAVGLSSRHPLKTSFEAPEGARLAFSFGIPEKMRRKGKSPTLKVELTTPDGDSKTRAFEFAQGEEPGWQTGEVDLGGMTGPVNARFTLETNKQEEVLCALGEVSLRQLGETPPTVILITSDTHRADYVGFADSEIEVRTPYIDALAERGIVFDDCATTTNVTNPSHVALMTGTHPVQTGIIGNDTPLAQIAPTLAEAYHEAGYVTWASLSAAHLGHDKSGLGQGFERMNTPSAFQRDSVDTIAGLKEWLPDAAGQPLFIWLHLFDVHAPYAPPREWKNMYYPDGENPYDKSLPEPDDWASPKWDRRVRDLSYFEALYRSEVSYQDDQIGQLLDDARFSDALIVFTSDHGESLGTHKVFWDHRELYPNTLHVPLMLVGPNVPSEGARRGESVRQIDLGRTLLDLSGLYSAPFPGTNLLEEGKGKDIRYSMSANGTSAAVMTSEWFFALHLKDHFVNLGYELTQKHTTELYNLREDPLCATNLVKEDSERAKEMRRMLIAWLTNTEQKGWTVTRNYQDLQALEQLAALGYTTLAPQKGERVWIDLECDCERCAEFE